jgi:hypothetical protein
MLTICSEGHDSCLSDSAKRSLGGLQESTSLYVSFSLSDILQLVIDDPFGTKMDYRESYRKDSVT